MIIIQLFRRSKRKQNKSIKNKNLTTHKTNYIQKKKAKVSKILLPWWSKIIAYILSFVICGVSIFFIIAKGITFGNEKVNKWLTSFVVSILTSFLLTQPLQIALITTFFVYIVRKIDSLTNFVYVVDDVETLKNFSSNEFTNLEDELRIIKHEMGSVYKIEIEKLKRKMINHRRAKLAIKEILAYLIFILILYLVIYGNKNKNSFHYKNHLAKVFETEKFKSHGSERISSLWSWIRTDFLNAFDKKKLNHLNDKVSFLIGYPVLRQFRIKSHYCKFIMANHECMSEFGPKNQEKRDFAPRWKDPKVDILLNYSIKSDVIDSFNYTNSHNFNAYALFGVYSVYYGRGYEYKMNFYSKNYTFILNDLIRLEKLKWIDKKTSAVIIEFTLYNPNLNLFSLNTFLFEILPTGNMIKSVRFEPIIILNEISLQILIYTICLIYFCFVIYFMVKEILKFSKQKLNYLKNFWIYLEWSIFAVSILTCFIFIYQLYARINIIKSYNKHDFLDQLNKIKIFSYWNSALEICYGILSFLGSIKFLKILRFNRNIKYFLNTIRMSFKKLIFFSLIFNIYWTAFVQLFYLTLVNNSIFFSSLISTYETTFLMMLNKLPSDIFKKDMGISGQLLILIFNWFVVFVLLNIIISILTESFSIIRRIGASNGDEESFIYEYIKDKIKDFSLMFR